MPSFGRFSLNNLNTCHPDLIRLMMEVIKEYDCQVTCGYRNKEDQEKAFNEDFSKAHWKQSPHNYNPSYAVDCVPFPSKWSDESKLKELAGIIKIKAIDMNISIEWGGDWKFKDLPHYEIKGWRKECGIG